MVGDLTKTLHGDNFTIVVTNHYIDDFVNNLTRSPTSETCHHYISSVKSVTNIDVTIIRARRKPWAHWVQLLAVKTLEGAADGPIITIYVFDKVLIAIGPGAWIPC